MSEVRFYLTAGRSLPPFSAIRASLRVKDGRRPPSSKLGVPTAHSQLCHKGSKVVDLRRFSALHSGCDLQTAELVIDQFTRS